MERGKIQESQERIGSSLALRFACVLGFLGVILGAFGAHAIKEVLRKNDSTAIWEKAVFYHLIHTVMLFIIAMRARRFTAPAVLFGLGIFFFSGSLYALALFRTPWLGPVTPLGGLCFLAGWVWLMINSGIPENTSAEED